MPQLPVQLTYLLLLLALSVVPRALQRFGIPAALTSLALGGVSGMGLGLFRSDTTIELLATFGVVSLFLLAGLEVDRQDLQERARVVAQHLGIRLGAVALSTFALSRFLHMDVRVAVLVALALLTPSTGFILDSLASYPVTDEERSWIRSKAIASEMLALVVLFVVLQAENAQRFGLSSLALASLLAALPFLFRGFARWIAPHAPRAEFSFLMMLAVMAAYATKALGVYYLVGAFVVGVVARGLRRDVPTFSSNALAQAVELFASFFVPFYFFKTGVGLQPDDFSLKALLFGAGFLCTAIPLRILLVAAHRLFSLRDGLRSSLRVALALQPTLVFTLVIAQILKEDFQLPEAMFGGLVLYALANTAVPSLLFQTPPTGFEGPGLEVPEAVRPPSDASDSLRSVQGPTPKSGTGETSPARPTSNLPFEGRSFLSWAGEKLRGLRARWRRGRATGGPHDGPG